MKICIGIILLTMLTLSGFSREYIDFNSDWKFYLGDVTGAEAIEFDDSGWEGISVPHDWAISEPFDHNLPANTGKLPWKGVGWYRKQFKMPEDYKGQQVYFIFDGIMAFPEIYINGKLAGKWDYGYNSFYLNVTELINFEKNNVIAVKADTRNHDSRWYPGAGIYRKVQMLVTNPIHVSIWGNYIQTPVVNDTGALVHIYTTLNNNLYSSEQITIEYQLINPLGVLVFNEVFDKWDEKAGYLREMDFDEFAERNIRNFIKRDRNHPCVVLWSVGNEIGEIQFNINGGFEKLNKMVSFVRKYDPTRPVTLVCDAKNSAKWRHFDYYDIHAWNYGRRYLPARLIDSTKPVVISESASTLSTRGFYELPLPEKKTDFTMSLQVSSYDLNAPWWAEVADDDFMWQQQGNHTNSN